MTDEQTAKIAQINEKTIRRMRIAGFCPEIKKAELTRELKYRMKLWTSKSLPAGICFMLERKYPTQFSRPEIQLQLNQQIGPQSVQNTIVLGPDRASVLANRYEALEHKAKALLARTKAEEPLPAKQLKVLTNGA